MNSKPMLTILTKLIPFLSGAALSASLLYLFKNTDLRQIPEYIWKTISELNTKLEHSINKIHYNPLNIINKIQDNLLDNLGNDSNSINQLNLFMSNLPSLSDFM